MRTMYTLWFVLLLGTVACAQQHKETITKELDFEKPSARNVLYLANINGDIKVEAYSGSKVLIEVKKQVFAKSDERLQKAVQELSLGVTDRLDTILVYVNGPCGSFGKHDSGRHRSNSQWSYDWNDCHNEYDFVFDFTVKVPANLNLYLSTVNEGDVQVSGVKGDLNLHNINGSIAVEGAASKMYAHTINGDVILRYQEIPRAEGSYFYTLNGDIEVYYPKGLNANLSFKSYNGDFYTNIDDISYGASLIKKTGAEREGVAFKVNAKSLIKVRGGGQLIDFETFNGDVYVRENQ